jgi:hypothetical protein
MLPNVVAWWDSTALSSFTFSSGTSVTQWDSQVGSISLVQATGAKQPDLTSNVNGWQCPTFNGSASSMATSSNLLMSGGQQFSSWCVFFSNSTADARVLFEQTGNYNNTAGAFLSTRLATGVPTIGKYGGVGVYATFQSTGTVGTSPKNFIATHDGTLSTNETTGWLNNDDAGTRSVNNDTNANNIDNVLFLGARNNSSAFLNGTICEFGFSKTVFSRQEIAQLYLYLKNKWGIV